MLLTGLLISSASASVTQEGSISGAIYNHDGSSLISDVMYGFESTTQKGDYTTWCTGDGHFSADLALGSYKVFAQGDSTHCGGDPSYIREYWLEKATWAEADIITLTSESPSATGITFTLAQGGSISGHVFKADGSTVITDVLISVHAHGVSPGTSSLGTYVSQSDGSYTITGLAPGTYRVQANNNREPGYVTKYYDNKLTREEADLVEVLAGQTTSEIDFALGESGAVTGYVYEEDGVTPVANACVNVSSTAPDWNQVADFCCTGSDGSFTISGVPPGDVYVKTHANCGDYHPNLQDEWYADGGSTPDGNQATPVTVAAGETTTGVTFALDVTGAISGNVFKADGSTVITDVLISVHAHGVSPGASSLGTYVSQSDGSYTITGLAPGTYRVQANNNREPGYVTKYYDDKTSWDEADTIEVLANQVTTGIDFALGPGGSISGHVYEEDGVTPIPDAWVDVLDTSFDLVATTRSLTDGSYEVTGLVSGNYYVSVSASGYGGVYYDDAYDDPLATQVTVTTPGETSGIDFQLAPEATLSGHVYEADGSTPIAGVAVRVWPKNGGQTRSATSDSDGSYTVGGLSTGDYIAKVEADGYAVEYYQDATSWSNATPISVVQPDETNGIDFTLDLGGSISGRVYDVTGTNPVGGGYVVARLLDGSTAGYVCAEDDGSYTISSLPLAEHKVYAMGYCRADPDYVTEYWQEKASWDEADVITLSADNREITGTDFTLELGGSISGRVTKADGVTPVSGACVNVSSTASEWNQLRGYCCTDEDGDFTIRGVPTGDVYVRTHADCRNEHPDLQDEWYASGGSTAEAILADTVTVHAGQVVSGVNFALDVASSAPVLPDDGGTLSSTADTTTTVSFPPHAVSEPVTVTFRITTSENISSGFSFLGQSFSIDARTADGTSVTTFSEPFTITIHYDDADVKGMEETGLKLHHWDSGTEQWREVPAIVDTEANSITATLDHLSTFAVMGKTKNRLYLPLALRGR
jgi:protocatechuate 3,4-dioxygenase beta subunit